MSCPVIWHCRKCGRIGEVPTEQVGCPNCGGWLRNSDTAAGRVSLSDLKSKRAAMSCGDWKYDNVNGTIEAPEAGPNRYLGKTVCEMYIANVENNATGIVATHNAADVLIAVCEAALAWRDQRADNLLAALARTDAEIEAEAQDVSRARVKRTAELASALERALAKITP